MIRKLLEPFKTFGFLPGIIYGINRALVRTGAKSRIYVYEIMIQPVAEKDLAPRNLTRSFDVRQIPEDDIALESMPRSEQLIAARYAAGYVCLGVYQKDKLLGYQWLASRSYEEDEVRCLFLPVPEDQAVFDFDFFVYPEHRFGLAFVALWDGANRYMRERGIKYTCSRVSTFNLESKKSHSHFDWERADTAIFFSGKRLQVMLSSASPYFHWSSSAGKRPTIRINCGEGSTSAHNGV